MLTPDQFSKNALREALRYVAATETEVEVLHAAQSIDVYASPDPAHAHERAQLGLLGELAEEPTLFEAFWNTPAVGSVRRCLAKQLAWHHELERRARAEANQRRSTGNDSPPHVLFPWLVILVSGRPNSVIDVFACREVRPGVYEAAPGLRLRIVVLRELQGTRATLLLRLFGREQVFEDAFEDFDKLPESAWERRVMAPLLNDFIRNGRHIQTNEEVPVTFAEQMNALADAHQRSLIRTARKEGVQATLLRQLQIRFGTLPASVEERVREANDEDLHLWAERVLRVRTLDRVFTANRLLRTRKPVPSCA